MRWFIALFLSLSTFLAADEDLVLYVKAKDNYSSVYISQIITTHSALSGDYLNQLSQLFEHDFALNGYSELKDREAELERLMSQAPAKVGLHMPARHVIRLEVVENVLKTTLYSPLLKEGYPIADIFLTGSLPADSELIHELADSLHLKMYRTPGIASKKILYSLREDLRSEVAEIYVKRLDMLEGEQVTRENTLSINPVLLPNSDKFIYTCYKKGQPKLYISNLNQTRGDELIRLRGNQLLPAISPIGNIVSFISDASGHNPELFIQRLDRKGKAAGRPQQIYAHPKAVQASSTFSPDCSKIAFVSDQSRTPRIYLIDVSATLKNRKIPDIQCITNKNRDNTAPAWSPDGTKIAYSAKTDGVRQIWIYDLETQEEYQITKGPGHKENPAWAANNLHLVYNSTEPTYDLYVVNLNQLDPVQITSGNGVKHYPYWEQ